MPRCHRLVDALPATFDWDELIRLIHERMMVERGLRDVAAGRVMEVGELRRSYGLER